MPARGLPETMWGDSRLGAVGDMALSADCPCSFRPLHKNNN